MTSTASLSTLTCSYSVVLLAVSFALNAGAAEVASSQTVSASEYRRAVMEVVECVAYGHVFSEAAASRGAAQNAEIYSRISQDLTEMLAKLVKGRPELGDTQFQLQQAASRQRRMLSTPEGIKYVREEWDKVCVEWVKIWLKE